MIVGAHGVRGEVRVKPLTDFPDRFMSTKRLYIPAGEGRKAYAVERVRPHGGLFIIKLADVSDRNAAEGLRGSLMQVPREEAVPLPEGTYYVFDLVGCDVVTPEGRRLGQIVDVFPTGANDVYHVRSDAGKELLLPAVKEVVLRVDVDEGIVVVDPPAGIV